MPRTVSTANQHPFGVLLSQYRMRKTGFTQGRLAELAGYNQSTLVRMAQGKKDLTGPSGRDRVVRLIGTLIEQGALFTLDEANALLLAADMPPLFHRQANEAAAIERLTRLKAGHLIRRTNLPAALTSFVGRAQELEDLRRVLAGTRLLTLTGAGGCGKTRLALRLAADLLIAYGDGVWYVELAALSDPALIADIAATALGLSIGRDAAFEQLVGYLRERQILLVLDNCEHMVEAVAGLVVPLLQSCPRLTVLTTSRELLNVDGELAWRVPPLQSSEAITLFIERGMAARSEDPFHTANEKVAWICERLDGMPLAIELAAARLKSLSLSDIAARLDDRFALFSTGARRGALPRHQTLRALIDWSYELLSAQEKFLFRRLGVFMGGWDLQHAEDVAAGSDLARERILHLLSQLVDKSLVLREASDSGTRFVLLETLRDYALARLTEAGELTSTKARHAECFLRLADESSTKLLGSEQIQWQDRLKRNYPNLQAALSWCLESGNNPRVGCRIVSALYHFWRMASGHFSDARKWTIQANTALTNDMPPAVRAWVLLLDTHYLNDLNSSEAKTRQAHQLFEEAGDAVRAAMVKPIIGEAVFYARRDFPTALQLSEEGVDEARRLGADWELRSSLWMLGQCLRLSQGDPQRAESVYRESAELSKLAGDMNEHAFVLGEFLSICEMERFQFDNARRSVEEAMKLAEQTNNSQLVHSLRLRRAECLYYESEVVLAESEAEECRLIADACMPFYRSISPRRLLARIALSQGNLEKARDLLHAALQILCANSKSGEFMGGTHVIVDALASLASARGQSARAARLRGAADAMYVQNHHYRLANLEREFAPYMDAARSDLGENAFSTSYEEGRSMTQADAVAYALHDESDAGR